MSERKDFPRLGLIAFGTVLLIGFMVLIMGPSEQVNPQIRPVEIRWEHIDFNTDILTLHVGNATITLQEINGTIYIDGADIVIRNVATKEDETQ